MQISRRAWNNYISRLSAINAKAGELMQAWLRENGVNDVDACIEYAYSLVSHYGDAVAELACQMYDASAIAAGAKVRSAEPAEGATFEEVKQAVLGTYQQENMLPRAVNRLVKQVGADTTLKNALRDGAQFAWIPAGDTCAFCLTLASNGWQYASKKSIRGGHAEHIHSNCDCQYAIRFNTSDGVAGYDPEKYEAMYNQTNSNGVLEILDKNGEVIEHPTPNDKINYMRRRIAGTQKTLDSNS